MVLNAAQQIAHTTLSDLSMKQVEDTFKINIISMFETVKVAESHLKPGSTIVATIFFSLIWTILYTFLIDKSNFLIIFLITYIGAFILNFLWYEWNVKKYNSYLKSLEED